MKLQMLAPVLCATAVAAGQSAGGNQSGAATANQALPIVVPLPSSSFQIPGTFIDRNIDKNIIVHLPANSFTVRPPQAPTEIAQKLYPDLKLQPVKTANPEPVPTQWPNFKVRQIPTQWQGMKVIPVENGPADGTQQQKK